MWIELSTCLQPGYEQYCLRRTRDWRNRTMSLQTRGTAMLFLIFFSCHVINGPDYSNEHMNLKTTSQKWCIYISNEINRRERERDRPYRNSPNSMVFSGEVQSNTWRLIVNRIILFLRYRIQVVHLSGMRTPRPLEFW